MQKFESHLNSALLQSTKSGIHKNSLKLKIDKNEYIIVTVTSYDINTFYLTSIPLL